MSDCCSDSAKLFLLSVIQGCLSQVCVPPGPWVSKARADWPHRNKTAFLGSGTLISAYLPWFSPFSSRGEWQFDDLKGLMRELQWSGQGDPELDPYRPSRLIPTSCFPAPILGGQAVGCWWWRGGGSRILSFPLCQLVSVFTTDGGWWRGSIVLPCLPWREISSASKRAILPEEIASASEDRSRRYPYSLSYCIPWSESHSLLI